jgi:hypothetical protein
VTPLSLSIVDNMSKSLITVRVPSYPSFSQAGTNPIPSVEDESTIYVLRLAANVSEWESLNPLSRFPYPDS